MDTQKTGIIIVFIEYGLRSNHVAQIQIENGLKITVVVVSRFAKNGKMIFKNFTIGLSIMAIQIL